MLSNVSLHRNLFLSIAKNFGAKGIEETHITESSIESVKHHVEGFWTEFHMPKRYSPSHKYSKYISKENYFQEYKKIQFVLSQYNNSLAVALATLFPEITWKPWRFHKEITLGSNFKEYEWWKLHSSVLAFFTDFISHLSPSLSSAMVTECIQSGRNPLQSIDSWYEISKEQIIEFGGKEMLEYHGSIYDALLFAFKDANNKDWTRELNPWKFKYNIGYWESMENRKQFFEYVKQKLGIKEMEDWYSVGVDEIKEHGGAYLLYHYYKGSPMGAITDIFPHYDWKIWKFKHVPKYYWYNEDNVRKVLDSISKELNIKELDEWYHVKNTDLVNLGCSSLLEKYGGIINMLSKYYPDHPWNFHYKNSTSQFSKSQLFIYHFISNLFPPEFKLDIHIDYLHPELSYSNSKRPIELGIHLILLNSLDIYIPALHLAFEYQGSQHYQNYYLFGDPKKSLHQRDAEKREICQKNGITLIEIPYWIDSPQSIVHLIHRNRPDISSKYFSQLNK